MDFFGIDWDSQHSGNAWNKNYIYGKKKNVQIFTSAEKPVLSERIKANEIISDMLDEIETNFNKPNTPILIQWMIHSKSCSACRASVPLFDRLAQELQKRLSSYHYKMIEMQEYININGIIWTGAQILSKFYHTKVGETVSGVPFFVQNFTVISKMINGNETKIISIPNKKDGLNWEAVYSGQLQPIAFLARSFNIKNRFLDL